MAVKTAIFKFLNVVSFLVQPNPIIKLYLSTHKQKGAKQTIMDLHKVKKALHLQSL